MRNSIAKKAIYTSLLLGTTFLVSPALAQNVVKVEGNKGVTAVNHSAVDATITVPGQAQISGTATVAATIGATGIGASGIAAIDQTVTNSSGLDLHFVPDNKAHISGDVFGRNTAAVASHLTAASASIGDGVANSIISQAIGASAGATISSRIDSVATNGTTNGSDNKVHVNGNITARNTGNVDANPKNHDTINGGAAITTGVSNSIAAVASGAVAEAAITQSVSNSTSFNLKQLPSNFVHVNNITAHNTGKVTSTQTITGDSAIGGGVGNTIGAQAAGASAGADISSQFLNVATSAFTGGATNTIKANSITAHNSNNVTSTVDLGSSGHTSTTITGGVGNSISSSAIGSSALASTTQTASFGAAAGGITALQGLPSNTTTIAHNITSTNTSGAPVTASLTINGNASSTTLISGGMSNSITAQAIGSLAGATISQHINNIHN